MTTVNFTKPVTSDLRADVLAYIRDYMAGQAKLFDGDTLVSLPVNTVRYNSGNSRFERWNGATWDVLNISGQGSFLPLTGGTTTGTIEVNDGTGGYVQLDSGDSVGTGYVDFRTAAHARAGYIGYANGGNIELTASSGWIWKVTGATNFDTGKVGLAGNVPESNWAAGRNVVKLGATAAVWADSVAAVVSNNGIWDGTNWKYITTAPITDYYQYDGSHTWRSAVSGTAGTNASMIFRMRLTANGDLLLGPSVAALARDPNYAGFDIGTVGNGFHGIKDTTGAGWTLTQNVHIETAGWKNTATGGGTALNIGANGNALEIYRAASGAAGSSPSWTLLGQFSSTEFFSAKQVVCGPSGGGRVNLVPGDGTASGYVEFRTPNGTRRGYIGWNAGGVNLEMRAENGHTFLVHGGRTWTTNGWSSGLEMGAGQALRWQLSGGYSWGIGNSGATLYFGTSTVDDASAAISSYWLSVAASTAACTFAGPISAGGNITGPILYGTSYIYSYGTVYAQGDVIAYYSDERLKKRLGNIVGALEKVLALDGFRYTLNKKGRKLMNRPGDRAVQLAVSAQQVKRVAPEAVTLAPFDMAEDGTSKSGENYLTVKYERLIPLLIEAIKELNDKVDRL